MSHSKSKIFAAAACVALLGLLIVSSCTSTQTPAPNESATTKRLAPAPNDPHIAFKTAQLMEQFNYSQQPLDAEIAVKFFDGYLDTLDPRHENFLQSDIDEFMPFRTNMDSLIAGKREQSNLTPAFDIFQRFKERFEQHTVYVDGLLKQDRFKLNGDDRIQLDRRNAPWPKDLAEAQKLWRQRLDYDYLLQKLDKELSETNDAARPLSKIAETAITDKLARHYRWQLHMLTNWDSGNVLQAYLNAFTHAYDPHSDYMNTEHAADFSIGMNLSLYGIGAQLVEDDGYCTIGGLIPGGPADKSGQVNEKDRVLAVAQSTGPPVNVVEMDLPKVVGMIRGPKGTQVKLTMLSPEDGATNRVVTLTRDEIKLQEHETKARLIEMPDGRRLGIISVPSFYATIDLPGEVAPASPKSSTADLERVIKRLKAENVDGILLDMRSNPGGALDEAVKFTGLFIKEGPVVQARNIIGQVAVKAITNSAAFYSGPLVVLVNRFSASAAEIAAAALQDYGRALVIGDTSTHGKGTVQTLIPLKQVQGFWPSATNDPGTLKVTIQKFYRVNGGSTQLKGVMPDIVLPDVLNFSKDIGEGALENPLPWDTNAVANFARFNLVEPYLPELHRRSDARLATNQDFAYIHEDIQEFLKHQADLTATLNENEALKKRLTERERDRARNAERATRPLPGQKVFSFTVESSTTNSLPPTEPLVATNLNVLLVATNKNGSVACITTNHEYIIGTILRRIETNAPATVGQYADIITQAGPDPMLDEAQRILVDYISLLSKKGSFIANQ
jgi:carboxyl-terminal processing protease